jgi:hypothetical protein
VVLGRKLLVRLQVHVAVHVADRKQKANLRPDTGNPRPESPERCAWPCVVTNLRELVADQAKPELHRKKVRSTPVEVKVEPFWYCVSGFMKLKVKPATPENSLPVCVLKLV